MSADDGSTEPRRDELCPDRHQHLSLRSTLGILGHVKVHLVPVEVSVIGGAGGGIDPERIVGQDLDPVAHDGLPMERGLAVEQHDVPVPQVAFHDVAHLELFGQLLFHVIGDALPPSVGADDIVCALQFLGTVHHQVAEVVDVPLADDLWIGQFHGNALRYTHLADGEAGVGGDHRARGEVDTFTSKIVPKTSLLGLNTLGDTLERATSTVPRRRERGDVVVDERGHVVLQQLPKVLDDDPGCARIDGLLQALVDAHDVHELVREVVLCTLTGLQCDGGANRDRGDGEHGEHDPFRSCALGIHTENLEVLVGDALEPVPDVGGCQGLLLPEVGVWLLILDGIDLGIAVRALFDARRGLVGVLGERPRGELGLALTDMLHLDCELLDSCIVEQQPATCFAGRVEQLVHELDELDVDDGPGEREESEVAWALTDLASTCLTP